MIRVSILTTAFLCLVACNNGSDAETKAQGARAEANDRSGAAFAEADETTNGVPSDADETLGSHEGGTR